MAPRKILLLAAAAGSIGLGIDGKKRAVCCFFTSTRYEYEVYNIQVCFSQPPLITSLLVEKRTVCCFFTRTYVPGTSTKYIIYKFVFCGR